MRAQIRLPKQGDDDVESGVAGVADVQRGCGGCGLRDSESVAPEYVVGRRTALFSVVLPGAFLHSGRVLEYAMSEDFPSWAVVCRWRMSSICVVVRAEVSVLRR